MEDTTREKIICPNCGCSKMEDAGKKLDVFEWYCFICTAAVLTILGLKLFQHFDYLFVYLHGSFKVLRYLVALVYCFAAVFASYKATVCLSEERERQDAVAIHYLKCELCGTTYRIARPLEYVGHEEKEPESEGDVTAQS